MKLQVFCEHSPEQYVSGSVIISIITYGGRSVYSDLIQTFNTLAQTDTINQTTDRAEPK